MSTHTLAVAGLVVAVVAALGTLWNGWNDRRHDSRIEALERERHRLETSYLLTVTPSDPRHWSATTDRGPVQEMLAHVSNAGAVASPLVTITAHVDCQRVGESRPLAVPGKETEDYKIPFTSAASPRPIGTGDLILLVLGPGGDVLADWHASKTP